MLGSATVNEENHRPKQRSRKRLTAWHLFFQYVQIALAFVSSIILVPIYLKYIPLDLYGAWLATGNILVWITAIDPELSSVLAQRIGYAYGKKDYICVREVAASGLCITAVIAVTMFAVGLFCSNYIHYLVKLPATSDAMMLCTAFLWAVLGSCLMVFSYCIGSINKGLQASLSMGIIALVVLVLSLILTVILLYKGLGLMAIALRPFFNGLGFCLGNLGYFFWRAKREGLGFKFSLRRIIELAKLLVYTFISRVGNILANHVDLFITARFLGPETVVVFNMTRKVPQMCQTFVERPSFAFMPAVSHLAGTGDLERGKITLIRFVRIILWSLGLLVMGFGAFNDDFVRLWLGRELFAGKAVNAVICLVFVIASIVACLGSLCFALGDIKGTSIANFVQAIVCLLLMIVGGKAFGLIGIAMAPAISRAMAQLWYFPFSFSNLLRLSNNEIRSLGFEILLVITLAIPMIFACSYLIPYSWFNFSIMTLGAACFYVVGLSLLSKDFRQEIIAGYGWLEKLRGGFKTRP